MHSHLAYNVDADTFTLTTTADDGSETVEIFTAPGSSPFNVCGLDCSALARLDD